VLYLIVMTMVFLRWTFSLLDPSGADPPAWIAAGAVAITVLAGSNLLRDVPVSERLSRMEPFIEGMTVLAWATATFWFPVMVAIGVWRHLINRVPLIYQPSYWGLVFPIGMYSVATYAMVAVIDLDRLDWVPVLALIAAIGAWSAALFGLAHHLATRRPHGADPARIP
jgi:tellurite resistance protein TehA-like permease